MSSIFKKKRDLYLKWANLDGKYTRNLTTWKWLCRSCHLRMDNVAKKAWETKRKKVSDDLSV